MLWVLKYMLYRLRKETGGWQGRWWNSQLSLRANRRRSVCTCLRADSGIDKENISELCASLFPSLASSPGLTLADNSNIRNTTTAGDLLNFSIRILNPDIFYNLDNIDRPIGVRGMGYWKLKLHVTLSRFELHFGGFQVPSFPYAKDLVTSFSNI